MTQDTPTVVFCRHGRHLGGACPVDNCPDQRNRLRQLVRRITTRGLAVEATTLAAPPGAQRPNVLDWAFGTVNPYELRRAGVAGVSRYISDSSSGKNITKPEYDGYLAAGVGIVLNWENTNSDYNGGYSRGFTYGQRARAMARALGHPDERPIIASIDTSVPPASLPGAIDYIVGFRDGSGAGGDFRCGCYATAFVLKALQDRGLIRVAWQPIPPYGWYGNGAPLPTATMYQLGSQSFPTMPMAYDENALAAGVIDYGQHPKPIPFIPQPGSLTLHPFGAQV